jgi:glycosyltransferase involved in cell wall biosynthesis
MPSVSVLMCAYNEPINYIEESTQSILLQTFQDFEFIIILDNPENKELERYFTKLTASDKRVRLYVNEKNLGLVASLNRGLQYCNGDFIARMDADDFAMPERLFEQYRFIQNHDLDMVGSLYQFYFGKSRKGIVEHAPESHSQIKETLKKHDCMSHPTWFAKREVFFKLCGYRQIQSCEDFDFLLRAVQHGYRLGNIQKVLLLYRVNENGISQTTFVHQKVVTKYLAYCYREGQDIDDINVDLFIQSKCYRRLLDVYSNSEAFKKKRSIITGWRLFACLIKPGNLVGYIKYKT